MQPVRQLAALGQPKLSATHLAMATSAARSVPGSPSLAPAPKSLVPIKMTITCRRAFGECMREKFDLNLSVGKAWVRKGQQ